MRLCFQRLRVLAVEMHFRLPGYLDTFDQTENRLVRETVIYGFVVWRTILDTELVPSCAVISNMCFGDTGGFVSRFAPFDRHGFLLPPTK